MSSVVDYTKAGLDSIMAALTAAISSKYTKPAGGIPVTDLAVNVGTKYMPFVNHGNVASTARPTGAGVVFWLGSVAPTNAQPQDFWYDTTT